MDAKEKAKELLLKFWIKADIDKVGAYMDKVLAKQCAVICVDELIESTFTHRWFVGQDFAEIADEFTQDFWIKVKEEIGKL